MDYGSWLKAQGVRNTSQSKHYKKQPPLRGSVREVRGHIIKLLSDTSMSEAELRRQLVADDRFATALAGLVRDGLVVVSGSVVHLTK